MSSADDDMQYQQPEQPQHTQSNTINPVFAPFSLVGKCALVTGASRGIGREIALTLARAGADVALVARNAEALDAVAVEIRALGRSAIPISADLSTLAGVRQAIAATYDVFERLDVCVSNAGISPAWKRAPDLEEAEWDAIMAVNIKATYFLCSAVGQRMADAGGGAIVMLASIASVVGVPRMAAYGASKAAVAQIMRTLALEWAERHVRVNAIAPGYIETDMTAGLLHHPYWGEVIRRSIPMGRTGQPGEITSLALCLASDASSYATGQLFVIDGGLAAG